MTACALLRQLHALGVVLTPYPDGTLRYKALKGLLTPALLDAMRQQKAERHALVEAWSERAAIIEYDGRLPRDEAERLAWPVSKAQETYEWCASRGAGDPSTAQ